MVTTLKTSGTCTINAEQIKCAQITFLRLFSVWFERAFIS